MCYSADMINTEYIHYLLARVRYITFMVLMCLLPVVSAVTAWWFIGLTPGTDWFSFSVIAALVVGTFGVWIFLLAILVLILGLLSLLGELFDVLMTTLKFND